MSTGQAMHLPAERAPSPTERMLRGPIVPTLASLAMPNIMGLLASTVVIGYDGYILGQLGGDALAGVALVLPLAMLMLQMSAGGLGAATTGAVARALGAGDRELATRLAQHALMVAVAASLLFTVFASPPALYAALGGTGAALSYAASYAAVLFGGAALVWCTNVLAGIARGTGQMHAAALGLVATTAVHLVLCPLLVFGAGPVPGWGVSGAAASTLVANSVAGLGLAAWLSRRGGPLRLVGTAWRPQWPLVRQLMRVGLPASMNPLLSNGSIALSTHWMASYGATAVAAYGVAARLEYIIVPIAFGVGSALTAMVATNIGAREYGRAKRVTWIGASLVFAVTGCIGIAATIWPEAWMALFTADPSIRSVGALYLRIVGACYAFFGLGLALFFASQGAARLFWALASSATRLVVVAVGGWCIVAWLQAPMQALVLVIAASFVCFGLALAVATHRSDWRS
jgi:putative MATE family efflux protein